MSVRKKSFCFFLSYLLYFITTSLFSPSLVFAASPHCAGNLIDFVCLEDIFANILHLAIAGASIGFFIMILSGGLKWLTSSGDPKDLENAKGRITFAAFGLFLMLLAWFILKFFYVFTGVIDITTFHIPS